jgi:hypothetical protein
MPAIRARFPPLPHIRRQVVPAGADFLDAGKPSLAFNGTSSVVAMGNPTALQVTGPLSIACFFKPAAIGSNTHLMGKGQGLGGASDDYTLSMSTVGALYFDIKNGAGTRSTVQSNSALKAGSWYAIACTWDGTSQAAGMKLYINGALDNQNTAAFNAPTTSGQPFRLGSYPAGGWWLAGNLAEPRVYNRALSAAEVTAWALAGVVPAGPVGEWLFAEGGGTVAKDSSGNGNDGTITNAVYTTDGP